MTSPAPTKAPRAVLFDLDGTLADTAPDLAAAVNWLRTERGLAPTPYSVLRPTASAGARGMIGAAFGLAPGDDGYEELRVQWFDRYQSNMAVESGLFEGVDALLQGIEDAGMAWGVVTNKPARFTDPLIPQIGLAHAGCIVSGDTMPQAKPHPAPLLEGARRLDIAPSAVLVCRRRPARHRSRPRGGHADGRLRLGLLRRDRAVDLGRRLPVRHAARLAGTAAQRRCRCAPPPEYVTSDYD